MTQTYRTLDENYEDVTREVTPLTPAAEKLREAFDDVFATKAAFDAVEVPSYTGDRRPVDYFGKELSAYNEALNRLAIVIKEVATG